MSNSNSPVRFTINCDEFGIYSAEPIQDEEESCQSALSEDCGCEHDFDNAQQSAQTPTKCCSDTKLLSVMLSMTMVFALCEMIFGFANNSLAMVADSFHMFSDTAALVVAVISIRLALRPETDDNSFTFGWKRAEIIGALINGVYLASVCIYILLEAIFRLVKPEPMENPWQIFVVGLIGLAVNIVGLLLFFSHRSLATHAHAHSHGHGDGHRHGAEHEDKHGDGDDHHKTTSANMHGVFLHVLGDAIGSIIVVATALVTIYVPYWWRVYFDPICSILFALIILKSSIPLVIHSSKILMQFAPQNISLSQIRAKILEISGIIQIHELHIWQLTGTYSVATVHIVVDVLQNSKQIIRECNAIFCDHGIHRTTVQVE